MLGCGHRWVYGCPGTSSNRYGARSKNTRADPPWLPEHEWDARWVGRAFCRGGWVTAPGELFDDLRAERGQVVGTNATGVLAGCRGYTCGDTANRHEEGRASNGGYHDTHHG